MKLLTVSDGTFKIDSTDVDGILTSLTITGEVKFQDQKMDNLSGTVKVPMGWSDADITLTLDLITDKFATCYDRLKKINAIFKSRTNAPQVFEVANRHLSARGVKRVVFSKFDSSESNQDDVITVNMSFVEYEPAVQKDELSGGGSGSSTGGSSPEPKLETSIAIGIK